MIETPDSLRSISYASFLDLVSEGEIEGLANGLKSVYFNETPLENSNGTLNFTGTTVTSTNGTQGQSYISGFAAVESENGVNAEVTKATSVVRQITNADVDSVAVTLSFPRLTNQNATTGDIDGTSVAFAIDIQPNGGAYETKIDTQVTGKTTSRYQKTFRIPLTGSAPWNVRVRRITDDSVNVLVQNKTYWDAYTEIVDGKFSYPNSAIVGVRIDSSQFDSIPRRAYDLKLLKVKIPSNYNPTTRVYTGIWDGTFTVAWTDNPAWCFYDLLTNTRYGLGGFISESQVDKWTLYAIAKYCDQLVPDGFGGTEPRYTCNLYIQAREEAFKVVNDMASIFRGMPYWSSGSITLGYDAPSDPVYQFTNSNVIDGLFTYKGSAIKARHTVALVTWNDPEDFYRQKVEYVEDADGIARYGIIQTEVVAVGCTSRGQANRVGRWILFTEQSETEVVSFKTGLDGNQIAPSNIIQIADNDRAGTRLGGRIASASSNVVNLDQSVDGIDGLIDGTLSVILPNGVLETKPISNASGTSITVDTSFSQTPETNAIWMVQTSNVSLQTFRVVSIVEEEDGLAVSALAHNPSKYGNVENNLKLQERTISSLAVAPDSPSNLAASEELYVEGADINTLVTLSWSPVDRATSYQVSYKVGDRNYVTLPTTQTTSIDIRNALEGQYIFKVVALNSISKKSVPSTLNATIYGKTLPPADVTDFSINIIGTQAHLTWSPVGDLDLSHYRIRHSRLTTGATYSDAVDLVFKVSRPAVSIVVPAMTGTYFIKAYDKLDNASINAAQSVALVNDITGLNVVEEIIESPLFTGSKFECSVGDEGLVLDTSLDFDSVLGSFDDVVGLFDGGGGTTSTYGTYDFADVLDLGNVYTSRITSYVEVGRIDYVNTFDSKEGDFDQTTGEFDGDPDSFDDTNVELWVSTTNDDPNGTPTWTDYRKFFVGDYSARGFKFRAILTSSDETASPILKVLRINVDMPDRMIGGNDLISGTGAGGYSVVFTPAFRVAPSIGIMAQNLQQGDFYEIPTKTASGFTIRFKNSSGTVVSRVFDYVCKGYGELIT